MNLAVYIQFLRGSMVFVLKIKLAEGAGTTCPRKQPAAGETRVPN
jgi:hypothetical protein